jgi:SAM-dependent methyltransferase
MTPRLRALLFETLYQNKHLYRFASTVPFAGQWRTWQRQVLPRLRGHDVLELGCGLGDLLADMLDAGYACRAVEASPQMVEAARQTLRKRKVGSPALIVQGRAQHLPFPGAAFDNVVSTFPTEYIYDPAALAEIERVLRPGGHLIVIEGANLLPVGFFQPFLLLLHLLVYGRTSIAGTNTQKAAGQRIISAKDGQQSVFTEVVEDADFGRHIPLEQVGLLRRSEIARSRRWEVSITIGAKPV